MLASWCKKDKEKQSREKEVGTKACNLSGHTPQSITRLQVKENSLTTGVNPTLFYVLHKNWTPTHSQQMTPSTKKACVFRLKWESSYLAVRRCGQNYSRPVRPCDLEGSIVRCNVKTLQHLTNSMVYFSMKICGEVVHSPKVGRWSRNKWPENMNRSSKILQPSGGKPKMRKQ
jgi:hypothetical protein